MSLLDLRSVQSLLLVAFPFRGGKIRYIKLAYRYFLYLQSYKHFLHGTTALNLASFAQVVKSNCISIGKENKTVLPFFSSVTHHFVESPRNIEFIESDLNQPWNSCVATYLFQRII